MDRDLAVMINGLISSIAMLVYELDKAGSLSKDEFAQLLRRSADDAENSAPETLQSVNRLDLLLLRRMAAAIEDGPDEQAAHGWNPTVIEGGREEEGQEGHD